VRSVAVAVQHGLLLVLKVKIMLRNSAHWLAAPSLGRQQELALGILSEGSPDVAVGPQVELVERIVFVLPDLHREASSFGGGVEFFI
jgi:hypothetical protein